MHRCPVNTLFRTQVGRRESMWAKQARRPQLKSNVAIFWPGWRISRDYFFLEWKKLALEIDIQKIESQKTEDTDSSLTQAEKVGWWWKGASFSHQFFAVSFSLFHQSLKKFVFKSFPHESWHRKSNGQNQKNPVQLEIMHWSFLVVRTVKGRCFWTRTKKDMMLQL